MSALPDNVKSMLQSPVFVHFATLMPGGGPQVSPVWVDIDGDTILINSAEGRVKDKNVRGDDRVALSFTDPQNPYSAVMIRGHVREITSDGAEDHIDKLAMKYLGKDRYPYRGPDEKRVLYKIEADSVATNG